MRPLRAIACLGGLLLAAAFPLRAIPAYDHVVVVVLENHSYQEILDGPAAWLNRLRTQGANITGAYGIQHPSQPNYYWLFSGSNQGILDDTPPPAPFTSAPNLYTALAAAGRSFAGYLDGWTSGTSLYADTTNYAVRHAPWLGFANVPVEQVSLPFTAFPQSAAGFAALPTVSLVIPALNHDMHDYDNSGNAVNNPTQSRSAIRHGNAWLRQNLAAYASWAASHNSLLIITTDEDSTADWITPPLKFTNADGFTSPRLGPNPNGNSGPNQITMLFVGAGVVPGDYPERAGVTNVNLLRTVESFYDLAKSGAQAPLARKAGLTNRGLTDIFVPPTPRAWIFGGPTISTRSSSYRLTGAATDTFGALSRVMIKVGNRPYVRTQGQLKRWHFTAKLQPGRNVVLVRAIDRSGAKSPPARVVIHRIGS
jgi:acid phosphatase